MQEIRSASPLRIESIAVKSAGRKKKKSYRSPRHVTKRPTVRFVIDSSSRAELGFASSGSVGRVDL